MAAVGETAESPAGSPRAIRMRSMSRATQAAGRRAVADNDAVGSVIARWTGTTWATRAPPCRPASTTPQRGTSTAWGVGWRYDPNLAQLRTLAMRTTNVTTTAWRCCRRRRFATRRLYPEIDPYSCWHAPCSWLGAVRHRAVGGRCGRVRSSLMPSVSRGLCRRWCRPRRRCSRGVAGTAAETVGACPPSEGRRDRRR